METMLAVLFVTFIFLALFQLSHWLTARILADHAAARMARARAVGFNDFMCLKAARVAVIPIAGRRLWPDESNPEFDELARIPIYLATDDIDISRGVLDYERWPKMSRAIRTGLSRVDAWVKVAMPSFGWGEDTESVVIEGKAAVEAHFPFYMNDQGLN